MHVLKYGTNGDKLFGYPAFSCQYKYKNLIMYVTVCDG